MVFPHNHHDRGGLEFSLVDRDLSLAKFIPGIDRMSDVFSFPVVPASSGHDG